CHATRALPLLPEIIAFSNNRYYDGKIEALRDRRPSQGWSPTGTVDVRIGFRKSGLDVNEAEAVAIADLIAELIERPEYDSMTFGVISMLGAKQAPRIQELLLDRLGSSVVEDRRIRCGDASNFQGDERDVIVVSLVVGPDESGQLGKIGAMTGKPAERRMNVAASRGANQLWVVHSIQPEDFPSQDPRAELIRHCREPARLDDMSDRLLDKCESEFERRVVRDILARGFRHVRVQWVVGNYRIDIVVEGPEGRRL
ncbi:DNA helicase, partial [mine drainage metagenome]